MKPSDCEHVWVKGPGVNKICMWCGIPQVRTSAPRPRLKIPPASDSGRIKFRTYSAKDYQK